MTDNTITLTDAATKIVASDVRSFRADTRRYADYVAEMAVTGETVAAHVAMFRSAYKAANKNATGDEVKAYATKVRNGLNRNVDTVKNDKATDWIRLVRQAAENAKNKGEFTDAVIIAAVTEALVGALPDGADAGDMAAVMALVG